MRKILRHFASTFALLFVITFILGLQDDVFIKQFQTGIWYLDILSSLRYYVLWVLPYWWLPILVGTFLLGLIFFTIRVGIENWSGKRLVG